jgi:hypothetical protein
MSYLSVRGEQSTEEDLLTLANLSDLAISPDGQYIRKTGPSTFENSTPAGGSSISFVDPVAPTGTINGTNKVFTITDEPNPTSSLKVYLDGQLQQVTGDYTLTNTTITFINAPLTDTILLIEYRK